MSETRNFFACEGCGTEVSADAPRPFRCPRSGEDDVDHVLVAIPDVCEAPFPRGADPNPFVRYRSLLFPYRLARERGMSDGDYVELVRSLDERVAEVHGGGFRVTPLERNEELSRDHAARGGVWIKDETQNVGGSHKARHLFGLLLYGAVAERTGIAPQKGMRLAIASCGNAAIAAAVLARATEFPLDVYVPTWASEEILERLVALGAHLHVCSRRAEDPPGDPCMHRFRSAVRAGAIPFACQGSENGLNLDGGRTLGFELATQHPAGFDRLFIQVGGGALASATFRALHLAKGLGGLRRTPRIHAVQTAGGHPLERAWRRVAHAVVERLDPPGRTGSKDMPDSAVDAALAEWMFVRAGTPECAAALAHAARHRSAFMWPWEDEPKSAATGILDDETYDWLAVVRAMITTGGWPIVVREDTVLRAHALGKRAGIHVEPTGTAGLAGLLEISSSIAPAEELAVLFTGVER